MFALCLRIFCYSIGCLYLFFKVAVSLGTSMKLLRFQTQEKKLVQFSFCFSRNSREMCCSLVICLVTIVPLFFLLDFFMKRCTTYGAAKKMPGPYMWPIVGALDFFFSRQGKLCHFKCPVNYRFDGSFVSDRTFEISTRFCKKFKNGFVYWSFGFFIYHMYSADSFEVLVFHLILL